MSYGDESGCAPARRWQIVERQLLPHRCVNAGQVGIRSGQEPARTTAKQLFHISPVSPRDQLIQGIDDLLSFLCKRVHHFPELVRGDRNEFQRMQNH